MKEDKEHMRHDAEQLQAHYAQIEEDNIRIRKENMALSDGIDRHKKETSFHSERVSTLTQDHVALQAHYDVMKTRMDMMKEIDKSLNHEELEHMKNTNLQVADTVQKLAQKLSSLTDSPSESTTRSSK